MKKYLFAIIVAVASAMPAGAVKYHGSVDVSYTQLVNSDWRESWRSNIGLISTTQGLEFKPWLYAGVGVGMELFTVPTIYFPIHASVRFQMPEVKYQPYFNMRVAYLAPSQGCVWEIAPAVGHRLPVYKDRAFLFSLGYSLWTSSGGLANHGPTVRIGYEW